MVVTFLVFKDFKSKTSVPFFAIAPFSAMTYISSLMVANLFIILWYCRPLAAQKSMFCFCNFLKRSKKRVLTSPLEFSKVPSISETTNFTLLKSMN